MPPAPLSERPYDLDAVFFDLDGVLIDSERAWDAASALWLRT
jgi:beta-phosphoglucomutase-like phosphatase (HAD superfamily)